MIKFFRRIRKKLADDNKPLKYMRYAIGEIFLVVIGILIALQINNWNEESTKLDVINSQLLNLMNSLKSDSSMWKGVIDLSEFRSSSIEYLLEKANQSFEVLPNLPKADSTFFWQGPYPNADITDIDFIRESFSWFTIGFQSVTINRTAINEINNLGLFSEIKNDQLKAKIHDYYMLINFHFSEQNIQKRFNRSQEFYEYIRDNYNMKSTEIPYMTDPIKFIKNDPGIIFRLKDTRELANWHGLKAIDAMNMAQEIIKMIEIEVVH
jgi:hypothetical protein